VMEARLVTMGIQKNGKEEEECVELRWDSPLLLSPEETKMERHITIHPISWLQRHISLAPSAPTLPAPTPWSAATLPATLSRIHMSTYTSSRQHLHSHLTSLLRNGIAFIDHVGTSTSKPTLRKVVERVGSIRQTWYGSLWDVKAEEGSKNIAYTDLELGLHMDLTSVLPISVHSIDSRGRNVDVLI
jgi:gamma-butyrobetaine dioxygenase